MMDTYRVDGFSSGFWVTVQDHFTSEAEAARWARGKHGTKMQCRIVCVTERVVREIPARETA